MARTKTGRCIPRIRFRGVSDLSLSSVVIVVVISRGGWARRLGHSSPSSTIAFKYSRDASFPSAIN